MSAKSGIGKRFVRGVDYPAWVGGKAEWTDWAVSLLGEMWARGDSAEIIAWRLTKYVGGVLTRKAVISAVTKRGFVRSAEARSSIMRAAGLKRQATMRRKAAARAAKNGRTGKAASAAAVMAEPTLPVADRTGASGCMGGETKLLAPGSPALADPAAVAPPVPLVIQPDKVARYENPAKVEERLFARVLERRPVVVPVLPTARPAASDHGVPFSMSAMRSGDPFAEISRRQAERGSLGRI
jgi:hypothetical protein